MAHPTKEVEAATAAIEAVYRDGALLGAVDERLVERLRARGASARVETIVRPPTTAADEEVEPQPAENRVDLLTRYWFRTQGSYSPELTLICDVTAEIRRPDEELDGAVLKWGYRSPEMKFFEATAAEAVALRRAVEAAEDALAARIASDLLDGARRELAEGRFVWGHGGERIFVPEYKEGVVAAVPAERIVIPHEPDPYWDAEPAPGAPPEG